MMTTMKGNAQFGSFILAMLILLSSKSLGYRYDEHFYQFPIRERASPIPPIMKFLESRLSPLENAIGELQNQGADLNIEIEELADNHMKLATQFAKFEKQQNQNPSPKGVSPVLKCPAPPWFRPIGSKCYFVNTTADTFSNAWLACHNQGSAITLAEPLFEDSASFYNSIVTTFPDMNSSGSNTEYWIGLHQPPSPNPSTTPFQYMSKSYLGVFPNNIVFSSPNNANVENAVALVAPGTAKWKIYDVTTSKPKPVVKPFICQLNAV